MQIEFCGFVFLWNRAVPVFANGYETDRTKQTPAPLRGGVRFAGRGAAGLRAVSLRRRLARLGPRLPPAPHRKHRHGPGRRPFPGAHPVGLAARQRLCGRRVLRRYLAVFSGGAAAARRAGHGRLRPLPVRRDAVHGRSRVLCGAPPGLAAHVGAGGRRALYAVSLPPVRCHRPRRPGRVHGAGLSAAGGGRAVAHALPGQFPPAGLAAACAWAVRRAAKPPAQL